MERRHVAPLIHVRLFGNRLFRAATALYALGSVAFIGSLFLVALLLQDVLHLSPVQTGLTTFPSALGTMLGAQLVTRHLYRRLGPRRITAAGLVVVAAATASLATVGSGTDLWFVRVVMFVLGIGVSSVFVPAQAASLATVDPATTGRASALFNAGKQIGSAVGVALLATVLGAVGPTRVEHGHTVANATAFHATFAVAALVALLAVAVALSVRDDDAAPTMAARRPEPEPVRAG